MEAEGILTGAVLHEALHASYAYEAMNPYKDSSVHYAPLLSSIRFANKFKDARIASVLDVGCGFGFGVWSLWSLMYSASGVDVSPTAIEMANRRYVDPRKRSHPQCLLQKCFLVGSVVGHIPFPSQSADAILSVGLLEQVEPRDVQKSIAELTRVARSHLFLQIASEPRMPMMSTLRVPSRGNHTAADILARDYRGRSPHPVERTLKPQVYWINAFEKYGFVLERNIPLPHWSCCAFVLRRNASPAASSLEIWW